MRDKMRHLMNVNTIFQYVLIVIIPMIVFGFAYWHFKSKDTHQFLENKAHRYSTFNAMYLESFIGETIGRLESLATVLTNQDDSLSQIQSILKKTHRMDPRFAGFYWVSTEGDIVVSSNPLKNPPINIADKPYFEWTLATGLTHISDCYYGRVSGKYIFSIATPVRNQDDEIISILVGSVNLQKIKELVSNFFQDEVVRLEGDRGEILFQTKEIAPDARVVKYSVDLEVVPWTVHSMLVWDETNSKRTPLFRNLLMCFFITNIIFMLVQLFLLKHRMAREIAESRAEKLKLIGTMAASTAHEIRNPLTGIKGFITLLREKYRDEQDQYYFLLIQKEVDRINSIVSELLAVGRPTVASKEINHVNEVLREIAPLIHSEALLYHVQFLMEMPENPVYIAVSKDHLKQILLNLTKNAMESMEPGGKLTITLQQTSKHALLKVRDTGKGMSKELQKNIFIPFFTVKENGTGLGLAVSKRILDSYGGELLIESEEGKGTEITIQIPLAERP